MRTLGTLLCACLAAGCSFGANGAYACHDDSSCQGGPGAGRCELDLGVCSFADGDCSSGYRFGDNSGSHSGTCVGESGDDIDAPIGDADIDAPDAVPIDARLCFGGPHEICLTTQPTAPKTLPASIDTGVDTNCDQIVLQTGGPDLCVIAGTQVTIGATRAYGTRPLVVVASEALSVMGALDASSHVAGANRVGPGANAAACSTPGNGEDDSGGAGGGGGGGFGGAGGTAGHGDTNNNGGTAGDSNGGTGGAPNSSSFIRGGCRGGNGGDGEDQGANGGDGGGAVYLIALDSITVQAGGGVFASGAGGFAGQDGENGAGGGGSGGLVGFDAPLITITGIVAANGAGGGGGGSSSDGSSGNDGSTTMFTMRAQGGAGADTNPKPDPKGGQGSATTNVNGDVSVGAAGGSGGGGGGIGVVWVHGTLSGTQVSPSPTNI